MIIITIFYSFFINLFFNFFFNFFINLCIRFPQIEQLFYYLVLFISKTQIYINRQTKIINNNNTFQNLKQFMINKLYIRQNKTTDNSIYVEFIKNNNCIYAFYYSTTYTINTPYDYDFIILTHLKNKIIEKTWNKNNILFIKYSYFKPEYSLIMCEMNISNDIYKRTFPICFTTNEYNYLIENNIFDSKFIIYFITKYYSKQIVNISTESLLHYTLHILDADANLTETNKDYNIIVNKDNLSYIKNI